MTEAEIRKAVHEAVKWTVVFEGGRGVYSGSIGAFEIGCVLGPCSTGEWCVMSFLNSHMFATRPSNQQSLVKAKEEVIENLVRFCVRSGLAPVTVEDGARND